MRILITGHKGFVGKYFMKKYQEHNIVGIDSLIGGYIDNIPSEITFIKKDCNDLTKEDFKDIKSKDYPKVLLSLLDDEA
jgi:UDP-glucose 4-epimerase